MEDLTDILDDLTNLDFDQAEQDKLTEKFKKRTQTDINEPFYVGSKWAINISQLLSIVLGFGVCLHMAVKFPSISAAIFIICFIGLILIEIGKRKALGRLNEIRLINKTKKVKLSSKPYFVAACLLFSMSIVSGYIGGPEVIKKFSEHKTLEVIGDIKADFMGLIAEYKRDFKEQKMEAFALASNLHKESNWKGTTSRSVRKQKASLVLLGAKKDSLLNVVVLNVKQSMDNAVIKASDSNSKIVGAHNSWCNSFAWWACGCVVFIDVLLAVLLSWMYGHEYRKLKENNNKDKLLKERSEDAVKQGVKDADTDDNSKLIDTEIIKGTGTRANTITVKHTDGVLKRYTFGRFKSYWNGSSNKRQGELDTYMEQISQFEELENV